MPQQFTSLNKELCPWATVDPYTISGKNPAQLYNLVNGEWCLTKESTTIVDPMNGEGFIIMPETRVDELEPFVKSLNSCPKSGLHNAFKNPDRYVMYGAISAKMAAELHKPEVEEFFTKLIQRVCPKHYDQARAEVVVSRTFLENFSGDNVRYLARGFFNSGNHLGQRSQGFRWPFGPVAIIAPFNFPLEIPALQLMGALYMGNKVNLKTASTTSAVVEQWLRFMHYCGVPKTDVDYLNCGGRAAGEFIKISKPRVLQFTGSSGVAEQLAAVTHGKVRVEDAGFDWKILGPDVANVEYVAWQCDQDAYALTGQKCSAESILFVHENWAKTDLLERCGKLADSRILDDLSVGPVLSHTTENILGHAAALLRIPGAKLLWGGKELTGHTIPKKYGAVRPTAVFVPLEEAAKPENFGLVTTEIFGPFQVVTEYKHEQLPIVLDMLERMEAHLTAAVVSNDIFFLQQVLGNTVNGTTYAGARARTTGAPQNHWFGPAGDPRGAGIGTAEAIRLVWSCHREIVEDFGPVPQNWVQPRPT
eukprot:comp21588_c0_seq1/m.30186 comp21588_c0_seq1/g.30186  ORF comp21588_c0_seq1/g.30186 comp21588_c0_seq1/m.30186 type:complete len:534 (-) comp21588_c0_seq1:700-2301(-)